MSRSGAAGSGSPIYGTGAPSNSVGLDGQSYVDTTNNRLYGPKASGAWPGTYVQLGAIGGVDAVAWSQSGVTEYSTSNGLSGGTIVPYTSTSDHATAATTAIRSTGLVLPGMVVGSDPLLLEAVVDIAATVTGKNMYVGIWDGNTELSRFADVSLTGKLNSRAVVRARVAAGDGVTVRDFHVRFGSRDTAQDAVFINAISAYNAYASLTARKAV